MKRFSNGRSGARKHSGQLSSIGLGTLTAIGVYLIGVTVSALFAHRGTMQLTALPILTKVFYAISGIAGCWIAAGRSEKAKLLCAAAAGGFCFLLLVGICGIAGESAPANLAVTGAMTVGAVLIGGLLGARQRRSRYV